MSQIYPLMRGRNHNIFRSGEWARIVNVELVPGSPSRICFRVEFLDGQQDLWPVEDGAAEYDFKPSIKPEGSR